MKKVNETDIEIAETITAQEVITQKKKPPPLDVSHGKMEEYFAAMPVNETLKFFYRYPMLCPIAEQRQLSSVEKEKHMTGIIMDWKSKKASLRELFILMKGAYTLHGKIGFDASCCQNLMMLSGLYRLPEYEEKFDEDDNLIRVRAFTTEVKTGKRRNGTWIRREMIRKMGWNSNIWNAMPDLMMRHRAVTLLARQTLLVFSAYTSEEVIDIISAKGKEAEELQEVMIKNEGL